MEDDAATLEGAPATEPDQLVDDAQAPAPSGGTSSEEPEGLAPFRLEDVPEEYREHVERYNKQTQGAFTRKTQELASQREQISDLIELRAALQSDDEARQDEAVASFLSSHGYEFETPAGEQPAATPSGEPEELGFVDEEPASVRELRERLDARDRKEQEAEQAEVQSEQLRAQVSHAEASITSLETRLERKLPDSSKSAIVAHAAALPRLEDGMPNMDAAIELWEADTAAAVQAYLQSKDAPPAPDLSGSSGTPQQERPKTRAERLALADQVAERTYAAHA
jgi:hypothetical protein